MPVLAGIVDPDFPKKPIKRKMVQNSRLSNFQVLAGILDPDCIKIQ